MEHLMHQLVGRSIARERERDLAIRLRTREAQPTQRPRRTGPPRPGPSATAPVIAHA